MEEDALTLKFLHLKIVDALIEAGVSDLEVEAPPRETRSTVFTGKLHGKRVFLHLRCFPTG